MKNAPVATNLSWWITTSDLGQDTFTTNKLHTKSFFQTKVSSTISDIAIEFNTTDIEHDQKSEWVKIVDYLKIRTDDFYPPIETDESSVLDNTKLYPHFYDPSSKSGEVIKLLNESRDQLDHALDYFTAPDLLGVATCLSTLSVTINSCYEKIDFNKNLRAIVGFIRRALLQTDPSEISLDALNQLIYVISELPKNPMLSLVEATKFTASLNKVGWKGDDQLADSLFNVLMSQLSEDPQLSLLLDKVS